MTAKDAATNLPKSRLVREIGLVNNVYPVLSWKSLISASPPNKVTDIRINNERNCTKVIAKYVMDDCDASDSEEVRIGSV